MFLKLDTYAKMLTVGSTTESYSFLTTIENVTTVENITTIGNNTTSGDIDSTALIPATTMSAAEILIRRCLMMGSASETSNCLIDLLLPKVPPKDSHSQQLDYATAAILRYVSPIIILAGTTMNLLTLLVLTMTKMWTMSSSIYLVAICICDTLNLLITLMRFWIKQMWNLDFRNTHVVLCKASAFLAYYLAHVSAWLLVAVSLERALMVGRPLQVKRMCTRRNAFIAIGAILFLFLLLDGHLFWLQGPYRTYPINHLKELIFFDHECYVISSDDQATFRNYAWPIIDMVIAALLPFAVLLTCNSIIVYHVIAASSWRKDSNSTEGNARADDKTTSMTAMLLSISFIFVVLTLPITIRFFYFNYNEPKTVLELSIRDLTDAITRQLYFINCGINFLLYCITGKRFRGEMRSLFDRWCCKCRGVDKEEITEITLTSYKGENGHLRSRNSVYFPKHSDTCFSVTKNRQSSVYTVQSNVRHWNSNTYPH